MIYLVTNCITGNRYIGKTSRTLEHRWAQHCSKARNGSASRLHSAIRKHGKENFLVVFLCEGLDDEEIQMIDYLAPEYNMTSGGDGGDTSKHIDYKARRSYAGEQNPNYGKRGSLSPLFGREKTSEQIEAHRQGYKGKRIPVRVDGVDYDSVARAAKELNRSERYVRLHDEINTWKY